VATTAAVIDVGSNSVRLLLAHSVDARGADGPRIVTVTGLRRGASGDGTVTATALERLDACLADYAGMIRDAGMPPVVAVGTAAVREAPNRDAIQAIAARRLGTPLHVVSGRREAELSFAGARLVLPPGAGNCRVIDIGGGSTEVVEGDAGGPARSVSLALGVNRQGDLITADPPPPHQVDAIRDEAARMVGAGIAGFRCDGPLIGVAGTVTTVAAVMAGRYDPDEIHGMVITAADVAGVRARLARLDDVERARVPGLHPDRAPVIVPGLAILAGALEALEAGGLMVSERDILDGIAMEAADAGGLRAE